MAIRKGREKCLEILVVVDGENLIRMRADNLLLSFLGPLMVPTEESKFISVCNQGFAISNRTPQGVL